MIAVTGANGFIGRALVARLNIEEIDNRGLTRDDVGSIGPQTDWMKSLSKVRAVVHTAARVHVARETEIDSLAAFRRVNTEGTRRLAEQAAKAGVRRLIFISSIAAEGPKDPYGRSKSEAEAELHEVASRTGLEVVIVRPPIVYGADAPGNFTRLIKLVRTGIPLPLGSVDNRRSMIGIVNLVDLLIRCIDHPAAVGEIFTVSDGKDISTPGLIRRIASALDRPARLFPVPVSWLRLAGRLTGRLDEIDRLTGSLVVDDSHTRETLDWSPPVSLDEGIRRAVQG